MSYQTLVILGNVGKDPEVRTLNSGDPVANFSIAVSERRKGEDHTTWFRCNAFGKTAEVVRDYVRKGSKVLVQGRIQTREYEKDGITRQSWEVVVDRLSLESPKSDSSGDTFGGGNSGYSGGGLDDDPDAIPF
jgi:single-strand DNA-binding protein